MPHRTMLTVGALALALAACGGEPTAGPSPTATLTPTAASPSPTTGSGPTPTPTATATPTEEGVTEISVSGGEVSGPDRVEVRLGDRVSLRVTSDVADEIHVHGYDLHEEVPAGGTAEVTFEATIPGVFEIELEDAKLLLTKLEVRS